MSAGADMRDQGIADVLAADTSPIRGYGEYVTEAIGYLANTGEQFDAERVRTLVKVTHPEAPEPHSPNVLPARMRAAASRGVIRPVGFTQARRPSRHASVMRVWQGAA